MDESVLHLGRFDDFDDHLLGITVKIVVVEQVLASEIDGGIAPAGDIRTLMEGCSDDVLGREVLVYRIPKVCARSLEACRAEE
jgi:hypothetical protein